QHAKFALASCGGKLIDILAQYKTVRRYNIKSYLIVHPKLPLFAPAKFSGVLLGFLNRANHIKSLFRHVIVLTIGNRFESLYGIFELYIFARPAGEDLCYTEWLAQKPLYFSRSRNYELVIFGKLFHTENRDNVLQFLIALQDGLHPSRNSVMVL